MVKKFSVGLVMLVALIVSPFLLAGCGNNGNGGEDEMNGEFFELNVLYSNGCLGVNDLKDASYFFNGGVVKIIESGIVVTISHSPRKKEYLGTDVILAIKHTRLRQLNDTGVTNAVVSDVQVKYFGTFNGIVIVLISDEHTGGSGMPESLIVGGVVFETIDVGNSLLAWKPVA